MTRLSGSFAEKRRLSINELLKRTISKTRLQSRVERVRNSADDVLVCNKCGMRVVCASISMSAFAVVYLCRRGVFVCVCSSA